MRREYNSTENIPLEDTEWNVIKSLTDLKMNVNLGEAILIVQDKESKLVFDKELRYLVSKKLNISSSRVEVFSGIESLHEEEHIKVLKSRINDFIRDRKVVIATAVDKKYNKSLERIFSNIYKLKVQK